MGVPSLQALSGGGGGLCFCHTFFRGGLENYLGGGGFGLRVWEGVLFFVSRVVFSWILMMLMTKCNFEVSGMPCNALQCCGVLWSPKA